MILQCGELRKWFGLQHDRFSEFRNLYRQELEENQAGDALRAVVAQHPTVTLPVTLLYGAKDEKEIQAVILLDYLS